MASMDGRKAPHVVNGDACTGGRVVEDGHHTQFRQTGRVPDVVARISGIPQWVNVVICCSVEVTLCMSVFADC